MTGALKMCPQLYTITAAATTTEASVETYGKTTLPDTGTRE
jgi:hypothetical protein